MIFTEVFYSELVNEFIMIEKDLRLNHYVNQSLKKVNFDDKKIRNSKIL